MPKTILGKANQSIPTETSRGITPSFQCYRCPKRFHSAYALGGHQNAHKKERSEEVRRIYERTERRGLALSRQSPNVLEVTSIPPSIPNPNVPPNGIAEAQSSNGPMVQFLPMVPGFTSTYHEKSLVFVPNGFKYGPVIGGVNGGEVPYGGRDGDADEKNSKGEELDLTLRL